MSSIIEVVIAWHTENFAHEEIKYVLLVLVKLFCTGQDKTSQYK